MDLTKFVPRHYTMDPTTEDLIFGKNLKNGMKVLIQDNSYRRVLPSSDFIPHLHDEAILKFNRWCIVSEITPVESHYAFIGVYEDGSKFISHSDSVTGWLVKKDSIAQDDILEKAEEEFRRILTRALTAVHDKCEIDFAQPHDVAYINEIAHDLVSVVGKEGLPLIRQMVGETAATLQEIQTGMHIHVPGAIIDFDPKDPMDVAVRNIREAFQKPAQGIVEDKPNLKAVTKNLEPAPLLEFPNSKPGDPMDHETVPDGDQPTR
jgi:hypothetical protein